MNDELDIDAHGPCFPGMQQLILAKCNSGVRMDSNDYKIGWVRAIYDYFNQFPVPTYPKSSVPAKAINHERTVCAGGQINSRGLRVNSTNGCYAGYYDHMLPLCYPSHTCNKYNPIKPIGYPPKVIPPLPPPPIENSTRLVYDNYYGAGYVQGKENAIVDRQLDYTTPDDACPYPDPPYTSYCKGYHVAYDFNWNTSWSQIHPIKPAIDSRDETIFSKICIVLNNLGNHTGAILYFDKEAILFGKLSWH
jgi:hypothetical protein